MSAICDCREPFSVGCDPELFIVDGNGKPVPAYGIIPGTKDEPYPVKDGAIQVDGMAAEININPARSFAEFNNNILSVMKQLKGFLPKGYGLLVKPAVTFDFDIFEQVADEAKELGCQPDFNAWTGEVNPPPLDLQNPTLRTASGHIHIGWGEDFSLTDEQHIMNCRDLVKQLDWYLGAYSVTQDPDATRRRLYGRAGAYRPKSYGVEYRVLSNFWITSRERRLKIWNRLMNAIDKMNKGFIPELVRSSQINDLLVNYINNSKRDAIFENAYNFPVVTTEGSMTRRYSATKITALGTWASSPPQWGDGE